MMQPNDDGPLPSPSRDESAAPAAAAGNGDVAGNGDSGSKITISWDELRTRAVEQRLGQMQAVKRNREYASLTDAPEAPV